MYSSEADASEGVVAGVLLELVGAVMILNSTHSRKSVICGLRHRQILLPTPDIKRAAFFKGGSSFPILHLLSVSWFLTRYTLQREAALCYVLKDKDNKVDKRYEANSGNSQHCGGFHYHFFTCVKSVRARRRISNWQYVQKFTTTFWAGCLRFTSD